MPTVQIFSLSQRVDWSISIQQLFMNIQQHVGVSRSKYVIILHSISRLRRESTHSTENIIQNCAEVDQFDDCVHLS